MPVFLSWEPAFGSRLPPAWAMVCVPVPLPELAASDFLPLPLLQEVGGGTYRMKPLEAGKDMR